MSQHLRWLFVNSVPLLYEVQRVARQFQVEMWLKPAELAEELRIVAMEKNKQSVRPPADYIV